MRTNQMPRESRAMTRFEVLVIAGVIALLTMVVLPGVANTSNRYGRLACLNNLRQIGVAFHSWGNDRGDFVPLRTPMKDGGLGKNSSGGLLNPRAGSAWFDFAYMSNQLGAPNILICPSDTAKAPNQCSTWRDLFVRQNAAVSYFVCCEAFPNKPQAILAGDRNLQSDALGNCDVGISGIWQANANSGSRSGWTNIMHFPMGNLLLNDGQVAETSTDTMHWYLGLTTFSGAVHCVMP